MPGQRHSNLRDSCSLMVPALRASLIKRIKFKRATICLDSLLTSKCSRSPQFPSGFECFSSSGALDWLNLSEPTKSSLSDWKYQRQNWKPSRQQPTSLFAQLTARTIPDQRHLERLNWRLELNAKFKQKILKIHMQFSYFFMKFHKLLIVTKLFCNINLDSNEIFLEIPICDVIRMVW